MVYKSVEIKTQQTNNNRQLHYLCKSSFVLDIRGFTADNDIGDGTDAPSSGNEPDDDGFGNGSGTANPNTPTAALMKTANPLKMNQRMKKPR